MNKKQSSRPNKIKLELRQRIIIRFLLMIVEFAVKQMSSLTWTGKELKVSATLKKFTNFADSSKRDETKINLSVYAR